VDAASSGGVELLPATKGRHSTAENATNNNECNGRADGCGFVHRMDEEGLRPPPVTATPHAKKRAQYDDGLKMYILHLLSL
jgi:hypothetical protein